MKKHLTFITLCAVLSLPAHGFGLGDLADKIDRSDECASGDNSCKNKERLKTAARVVAVGMAVKLIKDMVVEYRSRQVASDEDIAADYRSRNQSLQDDPVAALYVTETLPGPVIQPGKKVTIESEIVVVPGAKQQKAVIEERITIFDNEDNSKQLKSLTKAVNEKTQRGGRFENQFSFTPPEGLPQGVYPVRTDLLLNGKEVETASNDIQLVLHVDGLGGMQLVAMANP